MRDPKPRNNSRKTDATMLYRLAYFSHARLSRHNTDPQDQLRQILLSARRNNAERHITGALLSTDRYFAQVLEGEEDRVKALYQDIRVSRFDVDNWLLDDGPALDGAATEWAVGGCLRRGRGSLGHGVV